MSDETHLNVPGALLDPSDMEDQHMGIMGHHENEILHGNGQDQCEEEYSFSSNKYQGEKWEQLGVYEEDSEVRGPGIQDCEEEICQYEYFLQETKKVLGDFNELKSAQKKSTARNQQPPLASKSEHSPQKKSKTSKTKPIKKQRKQSFKPISTSLIPKPGRKMPKLTNLKTISSQVCDFIETCQFVTYKQLFDRFVGEDELNNKNLRRRMYDVINVLSSAGILERRGMILRKFVKGDKEDADRKDGRPTREKYIQKGKEEKVGAQQRKLKQLKRDFNEAKSRIEQKRQLLIQLKQKKLNLQKLQKRNQSLQPHIPVNNRLHFPLFFYQASSRLNVQINQTHTQIKFSRSQTMQDEADQNEDQEDNYRCEQEIREGAMTNEGEDKFLFTELEIIPYIKLKRFKKNQQPVVLDRARFQEM